MFIARTNISLTLPEIADKVAGKLSHDTGNIISRICELNNCTPDSLSLFTGNSAARLNLDIGDRVCGVVLVKKGLHLSSIATIEVEDPIAALVQLLSIFYVEEKNSTISQRAEISKSAVIGKNVSIGAFSVIGDNVIIEDDVIIHPQVVIYAGAKIGSKSTIHSGAVVREFVIIGSGSTIQNGAVIGSDGFGYYPTKLGLEPVPQVGIVHLGEKVDVGANSCIDRATLGATQLGSRTKLDNLVQVGHNVKIGSNTILCGQVGIAGSVEIGNQVVMAGNVGVADHIRIVDKVRIAAKSGVSTDLEKAGDYGGYPAVPVKEWYRQLSAFRLLPKFMRDKTKKAK